MSKPAKSEVYRLRLSPKLRTQREAAAKAVAETFYFALEHGLREPRWDVIRGGSISIAPTLDRDLPALETLMARYADRPMEFADATFVLVAEREGLATILTVDHSDFETYRIGRNAKFRILPAR
jgi:predicted nucleic acid-binding protein